MMKIYKSTEYIMPKEEKEGNLKLEVVSMWDWSTPVICYETIYKGEKNEKDIALSLRECTEVVSSGYTKWKTLFLEDITAEIKEELKNMGLYITEKSKPAGGGV